MRSDPPEELLRQLRQAGEAVLFCHVAPDGDTLGSARALELLLKGLGLAHVHRGGRPASHPAGLSARAEPLQPGALCPARKRCGHRRGREQP